MTTLSDLLRPWGSAASAAALAAKYSERATAAAGVRPTFEARFAASASAQAARDAERFHKAGEYTAAELFAALAAHWCTETAAACGRARARADVCVPNVLSEGLGSNRARRIWNVGDGWLSDEDYYGECSHRLVAARAANNAEMMD